MSKRKADEMTKPEQNACLIVIDGWGVPGADSPKDGDAITNAKTPVMDEFAKSATGYTKLEASSIAVGLPEGLMGNSEVGHLNIGAGRVVWQDVVRIDQAIKKGEFASTEEIKKSMEAAKNGNGRLHLCGLVSHGGVVCTFLQKKIGLKQESREALTIFSSRQHAKQEHLYALLKAAKQYEVPEVYIHFFGDGRDTDPKSGAGYMQELLDTIKEIGIGKLATVVGRYYAMDRDKRWERIELALKGLILGEGEESSDPVATVKERYEKGENDEFLKPIIVNGAEARIKGKMICRLKSIQTLLTHSRRRQCLLLQLSIRPRSPDYPAPRRCRPLSPPRLPLPQDQPRHHDSIQGRLPLRDRLQAPAHGQRPGRVVGQARGRAGAHCRD